MEQPNLSYIHKLSGGDVSFEKKLIEILKSEFPEEKKEYSKNISNKKYSLAAANVHKLKHKISILGLEKSYIIAERYEDNLNQENKSLYDDFNAILDVMTLFLEQL